MTSLADLPAAIPIFPLSGALLLPRARLPLHIFEPRYLAMVDDALKSPLRLVGMVQPQSDKSDRPGLYGVGCAGRITGFSETEDGRYMISLTGLARFVLGTEIEGFAPYRRFNVTWDSFACDLEGCEADQGFDRAAFLDLLRRYFRNARIKTDWDGLQDAEEEFLINSLAMLCPFGSEDKQALLEARDLPGRRRTLTTLLDFQLKGGEGGWAQ